MKDAHFFKSSKKLGDLTRGRDNNFNLIRIIAALAVLVSHSFALTGVGAAEPFRQKLGMSLGVIAVDVFFISSGFLVAGSLLTRKSTLEFLWARFLRIYPALVVMTLLTVFCLGPLFTSVSIKAYFHDPATLTYLWKSTTLFAGVTYRLPGVFETNPYPDAVNGSLWTLPYEIKMYAFLAFLWILSWPALNTRLKICKSAIVLSAVIAGVWRFSGLFFFCVDDDFARLFFMFFTGASFYVLNERIILSRAIFLAFGCALVFSSGHKPWFFLVYSLTLAYVLFYLAYIPTGSIRKYNLAGDYSYGAYIYAFPIQQSVVALIPGISAAALFLIAVPVTLVFAAVSWHCLERRALTLKRSCIRSTCATAMPKRGD